MPVSKEGKRNEEGEILSVQILPVQVEIAKGPPKPEALKYLLRQFPNLKGTAFGEHDPKSPGQVLFRKKRKWNPDDEEVHIVTRCLPRSQFHETELPPSEQEASLLEFKHKPVKLRHEGNALGTVADVMFTDDYMWCYLILYSVSSLDYQDRNTARSIRTEIQQGLLNEVSIGLSTYRDPSTPARQCTPIEISLCTKGRQKVGKLCTVLMSVSEESKPVATQKLNSAEEEDIFTKPPEVTYSQGGVLKDEKRFSLAPEENKALSLLQLSFDEYDSLPEGIKAKISKNASVLVDLAQKTVKEVDTQSSLQQVGKEVGTFLANRGYSEFQQTSGEANSDFVVRAARALCKHVVNSERSLKDYQRKFETMEQVGVAQNLIYQSLHNSAASTSAAPPPSMSAEHNANGKRGYPAESDTPFKLQYTHHNSAGGLQDKRPKIADPPGNVSQQIKAFSADAHISNNTNDLTPDQCAWLAQHGDLVRHMLGAVDRRHDPSIAQQIQLNANHSAVVPLF